MTVHAKHFGAIGIGIPRLGGNAEPVLQLKDQSFHLYSALGVGVCSRWNSFEAFLSDMGPRPTSLHVLGLYDPYGDFTPDNT